MILAVLSKDALKNPIFVFALTCALHYKVKIMLLHDQQSCPFPAERELNDTLIKGGLFKDKAVTFMKPYIDTVVQQILRKFQRYLDSKKQYDFLVLVGDRTIATTYPNKELRSNEAEMFKTFLCGANFITTTVFAAMTDEEDASIPKANDSESILYREIPHEKKKS